MRIVGGALRNRSVKVPKKGVRPTKGIVRGAVFNIIGDIVINAEVLDLFAGSGILGIEAISRGAKHCFFVEKNPRALHANISGLLLERKATILAQDYRNALRWLRSRRFDLILADPPYNKNFVQRVIDSIRRYALLNNDGILMIEHSPREQMLIPEDLSLFKQRRYGDTVITFLKTQSTLNTQK
jgi:16S rRNA (guanine966-N2)-methyltransferase